MKVTLPHLHELKIAGTPIVMVTAYDHPIGAHRRLGRRRPRARRRLGREHRARPRPVSTVGATMDELLILTRAVAAGCEHALVIGDLPFMSYQVSDEDAVRNAGRFIKEAGADCVKLEGAGQSVQRAAAHRRRRHPGDGPHRAHAADRDDARRPQGPGPPVAARQARSTTTRSRSRRRGASRSCSSACPRPVVGGDLAPAHDPHDRHRLRRRHRRPGARAARPARHARRRHVPAAVREALRPHRRRDARGRDGLRDEVRGANVSPRRSTPTRSHPEQLSAFDDRRRGRLRRATTSSPTGSAWRPGGRL